VSDFYTKKDVDRYYSQRSADWPEKSDLSLIPGIVPGTTVVSPYTYKKTKVTNKRGILSRWALRSILLLWLDPKSGQLLPLLRDLGF